MADLENNKESYAQLLHDQQKVYRALNTNYFFKNTFKSKSKQEILKLYENNIPGLEKTIRDTIARLNNIKGCLLAMNSVIKAKRDKHKERPQYSSDDED